MSTIKSVCGTRTSLTVTGLATLASATYVASSAYNCATNGPLDVAIEVTVGSTNVPAGNKQVLVFLQESLDGTNFRSGPTSGTTTTDELDLLPLGQLDLPVTSVNHLKTFSIREKLGYMPLQFKIVLKNDLGVALTTGTVFTSEISNTVL